MLLVFYFHAIAAFAVAPYFFGINASAVPRVDNPLEVLIVNGFTGVTLFFVVSGFIFTIGALQAKHTRWRKFYYNRFLRIFPLFLLINLVALKLQPNPIPLSQFALNLLGFGNLGSGYGWFDTVLWTISLEVQFYMIFPFIIGLVRRWGVNLLWIALASMQVIRLLIRLDGPYLHDLVYWTMAGRFDQFLIGMIAAYYCHKFGWLGWAKSKFAGKPFGIWLLISSAAMIGLQWIYTSAGWKYGESYLQVIWPSLEGAMWAVVAMSFFGLVRSRGIQLKSLEKIGLISFSLYILQYPVIKILQQAGWAIEISNYRLLSGMLSATLIYLPITIAISIITYLIIERPPLKLRKKYT